METKYPSPEGPNILCFFNHSHLPDHLQRVASPFHDLAYEIAEGFHDMSATAKAETVAGLRKLLEAKDCAVRAKVLSTPAAPSEDAGAK